MLFKNPRVLPALLICIGLGLGGIRYWQLRELPEYSPADIETSVELNYIFDLARERGRDGASFVEPSAQEAEQRKNAIRQEVLRDTVERRGQIEGEMRQGVMLILAGSLLYTLVLVLQGRGILPRS